MTEPRNERFIGKSFDNDEGGDEYDNRFDAELNDPNRSRSRAEILREQSGQGEYDTGRFSTKKTEAELEREKAFKQLDPEGYKKEKIENWKKAGKIGIGFLPVAGTIAYWDDMGPTERAISVGLDAFDVLTIVKGGSAGAVFRGAKGISESVDASVDSVQNIKNTFKNADDQLAESFSNAEKAQTNLIKASSKLEAKGLDNVTRGEYDDAVIEFTKSYNKFVDDTVQLGESSDSILPIPKKDEFTSAETVVNDIRQLSQGVTDQSTAISNAQKNLDIAIKTNPYQIEKAVDKLEEATKLEKSIAQTRLARIDEELNFLLSNDAGWNETLAKQLRDDKKNIIKKIKSLSEADTQSLQNASLALARVDTPTEELTNSLNSIKIKQANSLKNMEVEDLFDIGVDGYSSGGGGVAIKGPPTPSGTSVMPPPKALSSVGPTTQVITGTGALVRQPSLASTEPNSTSVEPTEYEGEISEISPDFSYEFETWTNTEKAAEIEPILEETSPYVSPVEAPLPETETTPSPSPYVTPVEAPMPETETTPSPSPYVTPVEAPMPETETTPSPSPYVTPVEAPMPTNLTGPSTGPSVRSNPRISNQNQMGLQPETRQNLASKTSQNLQTQSNNRFDSRKQVSPRDRGKETGFKLPEGKTLPAGQFPEIVVFESGIVNQKINLVTGEREFVDRKVASTKDSEATFRILKTSKRIPSPKVYKQGIMDIVVTRNGLDFKRRI